MVQRYDSGDNYKAGSVETGVMQTRTDTRGVGIPGEFGRPPTAMTRWSG